MLNSPFERYNLEHQLFLLSKHIQRSFTVFLDSYLQHNVEPLNRHILLLKLNVRLKKIQIKLCISFSERHTRI